MDAGWVSTKVTQFETLRERDAICIAVTAANCYN